ncbi:MAG TPA: amidohydrolase family protein, partial [Acidimicrobiales bacterium]|nr:amidohydrolase family protein [Acidimicrobiales bacterium]
MAPIAFTGGTILSMDGSDPRPEVVVVDGGRISALGEAGVLSRYPGAERVDLAGRTLLPGFVDAHSHLCLAALHPRWADLRGVHDADGLRAALRRQADSDPDVGWVRAVGWSDLEDGFAPTREDLDAAGIDRPVIVVHYSYHQCVVSSAGLDALGISGATPDPPGGTIGRSSDGRPDGRLVERAFSEAHERSMAPYRDPDRWGEHIVTAARALLAEGITAVHDAACPPSAEAVYHRLAAEHRLPIGVLVMPHPEALLGPLDEGRLDGPATGEGDERVRVGPVKLFADGGVLPAIEGTFHGRHVAVGTEFPGLAEQVEAVVSRGFGV